MLLIEPLSTPQFLITESKRKVLTHSACCLTIIPFAYWPIKAHFITGFLDSKNVFRPVIRSRKDYFISRKEFQKLTAVQAGNYRGVFEFHPDFEMIKKLINSKMEKPNRKRAAK